MTIIHAPLNAPVVRGVRHRPSARRAYAVVHVIGDVLDTDGRAPTRRAAIVRIIGDVVEEWSPA